MHGTATSNDLSPSRVVVRGMSNESTADDEGDGSLRLTDTHLTDMAVQCSDVV